MRASTFLMAVGFMLTFGAVGGIEQETATLLDGTLLAVIGLGIMACGVTMLRRNNGNG